MGLDSPAQGTHSIIYIPLLRGSYLEAQARILSY